MQDIKLFLEHRTINEIKIKCSQTDKEINPEYIVYDEDSLNQIINRYKQNKEQFDDLKIYLCQLKGNTWIAKTNSEYIMDLSRTNDKFISSSKIDYSFDDIINLLENEDIMIIFVKTT